MQLGELKLRSLDAGTFKLDGGGMHGRVPKEIWKTRFPVDKKNRITLATNCLLVETPSKENILIDTGNGSNWNPKLAKRYGVNPRYTIVQALKSLGLRPQDIHYVINSHLHFDHAGGNTYCHQGVIKATFPEAQYFCQKGEFEQAGKTLADTASYREEHYLPLYKNGQLTLLEGSYPLNPWVSVLPTPGHTSFHQSVVLSSKGKKAIFFGDLVPTSFHVRLPYTMGYDLYPVNVIETKKIWFKKIIREKWLCFWYHDPRHRAGYLNFNEKNNVEVEAFAEV